MGKTRYLLPVSIMSMAFALPTARVRRCVAPMPGNTPSANSGCAAATPVCRYVNKNAFAFLRMHGPRRGCVSKA